MARRGDGGRVCSPKIACVFAGNGKRREDVGILISRTLQFDHPDKPL